jgi:histidinol phosphatase-like enzyme
MPRLRVFPGAREKVAELARAGFTVVLATSAPDDELEVLRELLEVDEHLAVVTSAGDVDVAKPAPDLLHVALEKAGVEASDAVMVVVKPRRIGPITRTGSVSTPAHRRRLLRSRCQKRSGRMSRSSGCNQSEDRAGRQEERVRRR